MKRYGIMIWRTTVSCVPLSPRFPFDSKTFSDGYRLALHFNLGHNMYHDYTGTILPVVKGKGTVGKRSTQSCIFLATELQSGDLEPPMLFT